MSTTPDDPRLFRELDANGRFHRDSRLGRVFHWGKTSFREVTPSDALHVTIDRNNLVSVHVDHLSPLTTKADTGCRYSVMRALAHLGAHVKGEISRMARGRRGTHRCRLVCEVVEVHVEEGP